MRIPDPKANTTTEAYLAYKAGYLEESELKPVLYEPYLHFDAWLAYWAGLCDSFPMKKTGSKNLLNAFDMSDLSKSRGNKVKSNGICMSDEPNSDNRLWSYQNSDWFVKLPAGTYTLTETFTKRCTLGTGDIRVFAEDGTQIARSYPNFIDVDSDSSTFVLNEAAIIGIMMKIGDGECYIQLEEGSTATAYVPYAVPEMLCDEEALVAYLSGVTDTYPEEIKDPYDVRIVGYLKHLVSIRWPEPDYPVNNEEFYLSTMEPTHTSNSEPSADIELDTAEGKIIGVEAYGDTYQQTYSGKNLWPIRRENQTVGQVTYTYNQDGTFSLSGDPTGGGTVRVIVPLASSGITPGQTYTIWTDHGIGWGENQVMYYIQSCKADGTWVANIATFTNAVRTQTVASTDEQYIMFVLSWSANGNYTNFNNVKAQLVAGSTADSDFEPYTAGPAPNPDYPQNVQVVTGEQTMKAMGKNLLRLVQMSTPSQGITTTVNSDGSITVSGTASSSWATLTRASTDVALSSGETYTFSIDKELPVSIGLISSGVTRQDFNIAPKRTSVTATANYDNTALSLYIFGLTQNQSYNFTIYPQFEKGSSVTTYEPFQSQTYTVDLGSIELCKIGDYQDKIFNNDPNEDWYDPNLEDNAWYVHRNVGVYTFDGTESWIAAAVGDGYVFYTTVITDYAIQNNVPISKYFSGASNVSSYSAVPRNSMSFINISGQTTPRFYVRYAEKFTSVNELRTFMLANKPKVYYALETPTDTQITDATLVGQLEALAGADTYNGKTYIKVTATDPNLPALLKVEAYKY